MRMRITASHSTTTSTSRSGPEFCSSRRRQAAAKIRLARKTSGRGRRLAVAITRRRSDVDVWKALIFVTNGLPCAHAWHVYFMVSIPCPVVHSILPVILVHVYTPMCKQQFHMDDYIDITLYILTVLRGMYYLWC